MMYAAAAAGATSFCAEDCSRLGSRGVRCRVACKWQCGSGEKGSALVGETAREIMAWQWATHVVFGPQEERTPGPSRRQERGASQP